MKRLKINIMKMEDILFQRRKKNNSEYGKWIIKKINEMFWKRLKKNDPKDRRKLI